MAIVPGTYSCADHPMIVRRQLEMWNDPRTNRKFNYNFNTLLCLAREQMVSFDDTLLNNSCDTYKVSWMASCEAPTEPCCAPGDPQGGAWSCEIPDTGSQPGADCQEYRWNYCDHGIVSVKDDECKGEYSLEEKLAYQTNLVKIELAKKLQNFLITSLDANTTLPTFDGIGDPDAGGTHIEIPKALFTVDSLWDLKNYAKKERLSNFCYLTGDLFAKQQWLAEMSDCCNNGINKFRGVEWCLNDMDFDDVLGEPSLIIWDKGSTALFNTFQYDNLAPINTGDQFDTRVWREPLMVPSIDANGVVTGQPLTYADGNTTRTFYVDIEEQRKCFTYTRDDEGCERRMSTNRRIRLRAGFVFAPQVCDEHTGILKFTCKA